MTFNVQLAQFDVDINCPNENEGNTMPVINDIKWWIRSLWTHYVSLNTSNFIIFNFVNDMFIFIPMFNLMMFLLKNNLNGNKNNFGTAVLI